MARKGFTRLLMRNGWMEGGVADEEMEGQLGREAFLISFPPKNAVLYFYFCICWLCATPKTATHTAPEVELKRGREMDPSNNPEIRTKMMVCTTRSISYHHGIRNILGWKRDTCQREGNLSSHQEMDTYKFNEASRPTKSVS
jgi:hypothetical protein